MFTSLCVCVCVSRQPPALKQLVALYVGRSHMCWKPPEVVTWLEDNVTRALLKVDQGAACVDDFTRRSASP